MKKFNDLYMSDCFDSDSNINVCVNGFHEFTGKYYEADFLYDWLECYVQYASYDWYADCWYISLVV